MITRVAIKGYKSFKDVALDLGALTVVIGPNASGKSNLLDAIGLLSRMVTGGTIRSAFDEHRGNPIEAFFVPPGGLDALLSSDVLAFSSRGRSGSVGFDRNDGRADHPGYERGPARRRPGQARGRAAHAI